MWRLLAIACWLASVGCKPPGQGGALRPPPDEVWLRPDEVQRSGIQVARAEPHDVDDVLVTNGRVAFDESRVAHVLSPVSGRVVRIEADLGAHVHKGQPLAYLESPDVGAATADSNKAQATLVAAEHAYQRQKELAESNAASEAALEQAEDAWRAAKAESERAGEKVRLLHVGGGVTQLYPLLSPIEGDVLARSVTPGLNVQGTYSGGSSPELFTIGDLGTVWVIADIYETDLARVHSGSHVEITILGLERRFEGQVDWVAHMLDPQTRTARLRCVIPNPDGALKPAMDGTVRISVAPVQSLAVARAAIVHLGMQPMVFVDRGASPDGHERYERLPIAADESIGGPWVPVTHGLDAGDPVVVKGTQALSTSL